MQIKHGISTVLIAAFTLFGLASSACAQAPIATPGEPAAASATPQPPIALPTPTAPTQPAAQSFTFVSDGPIGPGWTRPDLIARTYFNEQLPALFTRTISLASAVPEKGKLVWIFTGPRAGFTVELSPNKIHLSQRFYDSTGIPARTTIHDDERTFTGEARTFTVVLDSHLTVQVLLNGAVVLTQPCVFDVIRHQLMFTAPRKEHITLNGALLSTTPTNATIKITPSEKHQTMLGFGGSPSIPTYAEMSDAGKKQYWDILRRYNLLIDREYPMGTQLKPDLSNMDNLADATPHYYGDNFPNGEVSDFNYSKQALALGGEVAYEMWALPSWAMQPYTPPGKPIIDAWNKPVLHAAKIDEYTRIIVAYCKLAQQRTGHPPAIVGIQNEAEQPHEVFQQMVLAFRRELDKAGFQSVKIHMADAPYMYMGVDRVKVLQQDPAAWHDIDYTAVHEYDYQKYFTDPDKYDSFMAEMRKVSEGKPFIATEICLNDGKLQEPSYRIALNVGQLYQKNLTILDAEALMYCWLILDTEQPNFGGSRSLLIPDKTNGYAPIASSFELRVIGAYSRHVLKGMTRVTATSTNPDLLTAAFADDHHSTLIVLNRSTTPQRLTVDWMGPKWTEVERTNQTSANTAFPYQSNSLIQPGDTKPHRGDLTPHPTDLTVQPGEILTLSNFAAN
jgi:O-glycosyl hydrolase